MNRENKTPFGSTQSGFQPQSQQPASSKKWMVWAVIIVVLAAAYFAYSFLKKPSVTLENFQAPASVNIPQLPPGSSLELHPSDVTPQVQQEIQNLRQELTNVDLSNLDSELDSIEQELTQ